MAFSFTKMHCNGNDYIVLETFSQEIYDLFTLSLILTDRRCGIGGDALIEVMPSEEADAAVRVYAPDGSETDVAGCAVHCAVKLLYEQQIVRKDCYRIKTSEGIVEASPVMLRREVSAVSQWIGLAGGAEAVEVEARGVTYRVHPVSFHGEHCVLLSEEMAGETTDIEQMNLAAIASSLNSLPDYRGAAVELLEPAVDGGWRMRMWIPGVGEARANANGVAACMIALAAAGRALPQEDTRIAVRGGEMVVRAEGDRLLLTGKVQAVFDGFSQL